MVYAGKCQIKGELLGRLQVARFVVVVKGPRRKPRTAIKRGSKPCLRVCSLEKKRVQDGRKHRGKHSKSYDSLGGRTILQHGVTGRGRSCGRKSAIVPFKGECQGEAPGLIRNQKSERKRGGKG